MKLLQILVIVGAVLLLALSVDGRRKQRVKVRGTLFCPSNPKRHSGVKVKLVDHDTGPDPDDKMAETTTAADGSFSLEGEESETTNIDPVLKIYHDCNDGIKPCQRKWKIVIPDRYINKDEYVEVGTLNLEMVLKEEERDCIH